MVELKLHDRMGVHVDRAERSDWAKRVYEFLKASKEKDDQYAILSGRYLCYGTKHGDWIKINDCEVKREWYSGIEEHSQSCACDRETSFAVTND